MDDFHIECKHFHLTLQGAKTIQGMEHISYDYFFIDDTYFIIQK